MSNNGGKFFVGLSRCFIILFLILGILENLKAQNVDQIFKSARSAFQDGLWNSAAAQFIRFLNNYPEDHRSDSVAYMAAVAYYNMDNYQKCIELLAEFEKRYSDSVWKQRTNYWKGMAHFELEQWKSAAKAFRRQVEIVQQKAYRQRSLFYLGASYEKLAAWSNASSAYERIIDEDEIYELVVHALFRLGQVKIAQEKYNDAYKLFQTLAYKYADSSLAEDSSYWIAETLWRQNRDEEALKMYQVFLSSVYNSTNRVRALLEAARLSSKLNEDEQALAYLDLREEELKSYAAHSSPDQTRKKSDEYSIALRIRASSSLRTGKIPEARVAYKAIIQDAPNKSERQRAQFNLAQTWLGTNELNKAVPHLESSAEGPNEQIRSDSVYLAATILSHLNKPRADEWLLRFASQFPQDSRREEVLRILVNTQQTRSKSNPEIEHGTLLSRLTTLIEDYPKSSFKNEYLFLRARILAESGDSTSALRDYARITSASPGSEDAPKANSGIALIYAERGEYARAATYYIKAAELLGGVSGGVEGRTAIYSAAVAYANSERFEDALVFFNKIIGDDPGGKWGVEAAYYRAETFVRMRNMEDARRSYELAARYGGSEWQFDSAYGIAWTWFAGAEWAEAEKGFARAMELAANKEESSLAAYRIALSRASLQDWNGAINMYNKILEMDVYARREATLYQKSWALINLGDRNQFDNTLTMLGDEFPQSELPADLYFKMGEKRLRDARYLSAVEWFDACWKNFGDSNLAIQAELRSARVTALHGDFQIAARRYKAWLKKYSGSASVSVAVRGWANVLKDIGDEEASRNAMDILAGIISRPALMAPIKLAWIQNANIPSEAINDLEQMVNDNSLEAVDRREALLLRAHKYRMDGQSTHARQIYQTIVSESNDRPGALAQESLAQIFVQSGELEKAADAYLTLIYLYPNYNEIVDRASNEAEQIFRKLGREEEANKLRAGKTQHF